MSRFLSLLMIILPHFSWSQTCITSYPPIDPIASDCLFESEVYDPRTGEDEMRPFLPLQAAGTCSEDDSSITRFRAVSKYFSRKRADQPNFVSQGLDPATLAPQGIDLSFSHRLRYPVRFP